MCESRLTPSGKSLRSQELVVYQSMGASILYALDFVPIQSLFLKEEPRIALAYNCFVANF